MVEFQKEKVEIKIEYLKLLVGTFDNIKYSMYNTYSTEGHSGFEACGDTMENCHSGGVIMIQCISEAGTECGWKISNQKIQIAKCSIKNY